MREADSHFAVQVDPGRNASSHNGSGKGSLHMGGFDETFDFVVVGSGGGSMCAAIVACSAGKSDQ